MGARSLAKYAYPANVCKERPQGKAERFDCVPMGRRKSAATAPRPEIVTRRD